MKMIGPARVILLAVWLLNAFHTEAAGQIEYDAPDPVLDQAVTRCLNTEGVTFFETDRTLCYNAAIFPEQFLKLNELPAAQRVILTSPGGNVATARLMSRILQLRGEPVIIAGQCMSACAMVLLPGLKQVGIHRSAHLAVHGITMMDYPTWFGWLRDGAAPSRINLVTAQLGYDFDYMLHLSGRDHMRDHLTSVAVDLGFIQTVSRRMEKDAADWPCRLDPKEYWGMLDAQHLKTYLGDRLTRLESFAGHWDDPGNRIYREITQPLGAQTYVFKGDLQTAGCADGS